MELPLVIVFVCGVVAFAAHRAALDSGHPLVADMHRASRWLHPRVTLAGEFVVLVLALLLATRAGPVWGPVWAGVYLLYTAASCWAALVLRR